MLDAYLVFRQKARINRDPARKNMNRENLGDCRSGARSPVRKRDVL